MKQLKTIKLKGKDYVQVNERVLYFNDTFKNGSIKTVPTFQDDTVYFRAVVTPDMSNVERFFVGHSFGNLKAEKALEKLETVAVGRALAFMGIGIVEGIASADEMDRFQKKEELIQTGKCSICGAQGIPGKYGAYCPNYKDALHKGKKPTWIFDDKKTPEEQAFIDSLPEQDIPIIK